MAEALAAGMRMYKKSTWRICTDCENARIIGSTSIDLNLLMVADGRRIYMERYTYFDSGKFRLKIDDTEYSGDWVDRLAAYEETGLKPEAVEHLKLASMGKAIAEIKEFEGVPIDRLRKLAQAEKTGQLVVLSEPMKPMVYKPNDTDVYCPSCGESLSGGWPLSDADDLRKLCQCPNCGQSIDDTRCEAAEAALKEKEAEHESNV